MSADLDKINHIIMAGRPSSTREYQSFLASYNARYAFHHQEGCSYEEVTKSPRELLVKETTFHCTGWRVGERKPDHHTNDVGQDHPHAFQHGEGHSLCLGRKASRNLSHLCSQLNYFRKRRRMVAGWYRLTTPAGLSLQLRRGGILNKYWETLAKSWGMDTLIA